MKKILRIIIVLSLTFFSFYYTDKIIYLSKMKDPLMKRIIEYKNKNDISYDNGILTKNTMLVGSSSKEINISKSYEKMKRTNTFNENLLEYKKTVPIISKENNIDKLIKGKKTKEKNISIVFEIDNINELDEISYILKKNNVEATIYLDGKIIEDNILTIDNYLSNNISIGYYSYNNKYDTLSFKYYKGMLNSTKIKISDYCLYKNKNFLKTCIKNKTNTISPIIIKKDLYSYIKLKKENGYIYKIVINQFNIKQLNSTILYLKGKGYNIISTDKLLKE